MEAPWAWMLESKDATPMKVIFSIAPTDCALLDILLTLSDMA